MLSILDVVDLIKPLVPEATVYPLEYPIDSPDLCVVVDVSSAQRPTAGVYPLRVQVKVRAEHPSIAEVSSLTIRKALEEISNLKIKDVQVIYIQTVNPFPLFVGKDSASNYLYSTNYIFMMNEGV